MITRYPVKSSTIARLGYDIALEVLAVEFKSGAVYEYDAVPPIIAESIVKADSIGTYFGLHVKDKFETFKIVNGQRVPIALAKASKASREYLLRLAKNAGISDGTANERLSSRWRHVIAAAKEPTALSMNQLVDTWIDSLKQPQVTAAIEYLKDLTS